MSDRINFESRDQMMFSGADRRTDAAIGIGSVVRSILAGHDAPPSPVNIQYRKDVVSVIGLFASRPVQAGRINANG